MAKRNCGHCHTCGSPLRQVLDGGEWCPRCKTYRRYKSHGWAGGEISPCPEIKPREEKNVQGRSVQENH